MRLRLKLGILSIVVSLCWGTLESDLNAFIPKSIQKVCVLDFSGSEDHGIAFAVLLRKALGDKGFFAVTDEGVLIQLQVHYPYLFEQPFGSKVIQDIGKLLNVDAVLVGHVGLFDIQEKVVSDQEHLKIETTMAMEVGYRLYDTRQVHVLEETMIDVYQTVEDRSLSFRTDQDKALLREHLMQKGVKRMICHIQEARTGFDLRPAEQPLELSENSKSWKTFPFLVRKARLYSGALVPEKLAKVFDRGDPIWLNIVFDNLRQTTQGEVWLQMHASVTNEDYDIVLDIPYWVNRRMVMPLDRDARSFPLTLRLKMPERVAAGRYKLHLVSMDRILSQAVNHVFEFDIKNS